MKVPFNEIKSILDHPIYSQFTRGKERFNGILDEFVSMGWLTESRKKKIKYIENAKADDFCKILEDYGA